MKKILAITLLLILVASVFVVASSAADAPDYWEINRNCLVKVMGIEDEEGNITVSSFKEVAENNSGCNGLIVGLPTYATVGDEFFEAKDGYYFIYTDAKGNELIYGDDHIGTADKLVVYDENDEIAATYGLVTYGDADGDGVFDVIDSSIAARCLNGFLDATEAPEIYEAVKTRLGMNNDLVEVEDYQQVVNDCIIGEIEENLKGRKTPIDQTIYFESIIYENTGAKRTAEFTAVDDNFKDLVTINYNGSEEAPLASGIYSVTANVADSEKYLVTPGEVELGFIVIAPASAVSNGYKIIVDNTDKKIVVATTDNSKTKAPLKAEFEKWLNDAYELTVGSTKNPTTVDSTLPKRDFVIYSNQSTSLTQASDSAVLGSYLPDDETLWANNTASNSKQVNVSADDVSFDFSVCFQQDEVTIKNAKSAYLLAAAVNARGQRTTSNETAYVYAKEIKGYPAVRVAVKDASKDCASALGGTGLKTVLVGITDAIAIQSSATDDFSNSEVISLFYAKNNNVRYSTLKIDKSAEGIKNAGIVLPIVNSVLKGLKISMPTNAISLALTPLSKLDVVGNTGFCNYRCSQVTTNIRYNTVYYLEFMNYNNTEDSHYTLTVGSNVTMVLPTGKTNYYLDRMAGNDIVLATAPAGYKLKLTDANGNEIPMQDEGYFLMPYSNATLTAVAE